MITRIISPEIAASRKSLLLLGPRQVGKSTLIKSLKPDLEINLADELEFLKYSSRPEAFRQTIENNKPRSVYVDEIQRLPKLLNTIQAIIDHDKKIKFFLTGSSARKLRRGEVNLIPGRLVNFFLGPLASGELGHEMNTLKVLEYGSLPEVYLSTEKKENERLLKSYSGNYLKEEIKAESLVRNLDSFARFFQEATLRATEFIDYTKLSSRSKISRHAIPRYFEILEDTLVGYRVFPFTETAVTNDLVKHPKFYFFDNGVYNGLLDNFTASLDRVGRLSEQLVFSQIKHSAWTQEKEAEISSFRTRNGIEVDFIVKIKNQVFAIEVKNSADLTSEDLNGLQYFDQVFSQTKKKLFVFHMGKNEKKEGKIWILPWQKGLQEMGL